MQSHPESPPSAPSQSLLRLSQVTRTYRLPNAPDVDVLRGVDLALAAGETLAIVGPSGSGKTTLLNIIGALDRPTSGEALLDGVDIGRLPDAEQARVRNRKIGFIFQLHHLLPQCTVLENVLVPTLVHPSPGPAAQRAAGLLERAGLGARLNHHPSQLSGGELQRVAVVRALINRPLLLLADEPTGSLDQRAAEGIAQLLLDLNAAEHTALVVVTHSRPLADRMDRMLDLRDGLLCKPR